MRSGLVERPNERRQTATAGGGIGAASEHTEKLTRYLQAYWLRPENALWMTLRSDALARCALEAPSVDVGCGDGVFMFLHGGGVFDASFDVFQAVGSLDRVRDEHADMFDAACDNYDPPVVSPARHVISRGLDLKRSLLTKAAHLGVYEQLVPHDANDPLPIRSDSVRTVYCNAAYWLENIDEFLRELRRIVQPGGAVILHAKLDTIRSCTLNGFRSILGDRFLDIIGRGRFDTWPSLMSQSQWEKKFTGTGLHIADCFSLATQSHAQLWDVGLRPLAPMLVRLANEVPIESRVDIKQQWVETVLELIKPFYRFDLALSPDASESVELQYVLTVP